VAYCRTSGDQSENTSLDSQKAKIEAKCLIDDHCIVASFVDKESAETAEKRDGFQQALHYIYSGEADGLIVWKLDRFARSVLDGVQILKQFKERSKQLICVADYLDTSSPMGEAFFQISMVFAELERKTIAERCHGGRLARAAQQRYACGSPPYGFRASHDGAIKVLMKDPAEQRIIALIKRLRESQTGTISYERIAAILTLKKTPPPCGNRVDKLSRD
jgi:DNA invertase Pin-like site-specific DNA recombinase